MFAIDCNLLPDGLEFDLSFMRVKTTSRIWSASSELHNQGVAAKHHAPGTPADFDAGLDKFVFLGMVAVLRRLGAFEREQLDDVAHASTSTFLRAATKLLMRVGVNTRS